MYQTGAQPQAQQENETLSAASLDQDANFAR